MLTVTPRLYIGVSLKMYFGFVAGRDWFHQVAATSARHPAVVRGDIVLFVVPTHLQVTSALDAFRGTAVLVGAQDGAAEDSGAFTGEVSAAELAEVGVTLVEVGHAERRDLFGENDQIVAAKTSAILRNGMTPLLCLGEPDGMTPAEASAFVVAQLNSALDSAPEGRVLVAYEPIWAIGAEGPAPVERVQEVCEALRAALRGLPGRDGSAVIYGGSARPGVLEAFNGHVDGLFLGRYAHDPDALWTVLDEAASVIAAAPPSTVASEAHPDPTTRRTT